MPKKTVSDQFFEAAINYEPFPDVSAPPPAPDQPSKTTVKKRKVTIKKDQDKPHPKEAKEMIKENPSWFVLYGHLQRASNEFLSSLTQREDIPADAKSIINGVLALRDSQEMFFVEGNDLTEEAAIFWSDALITWTKRPKFKEEVTAQYHDLTQ